MRDLRELWEREGAGGVIGLALVLAWAVQCEYQIVQYGVQALSALF